MSGRVVYRETAAEDLRNAAQYYAEQEQDLSLKFLDAVDEAAAFIADFPAAGSTRFSELLSLQKVRHHSLKVFPYIFFYVETADSIEVLRVLNTHQDIFQILDSD